jgi:hypothetical protein
MRVRGFSMLWQAEHLLNARSPLAASPSANAVETPSTKKVAESHVRMIVIPKPPVLLKCKTPFPSIGRKGRVVECVRLTEAGVSR